MTTYASVPVRADVVTFFTFDDHTIPFRENLRVKMRQPTKHPNNPVVPRGREGEPDYWRAQYYGSVVHHEGMYKMWYVAADEKTRRVSLHPRFYGWRPAYAESRDGINWIKPKLGLVISNDGIHFREPIRDFPFIPFGKDGEWDEGGLISGQGFEHFGDRTYIWYGTWDLRDINAKVSQRGDVGLVTMRRDGFGSVGKKDSDRKASLITCPFCVHEPVRVSVNVEGASDKNRLCIELLDEREQLVPGFSNGSAATVCQSGVHVPVSWKNGQELIPERGAFRLRAAFQEKAEPALELYTIHLEAIA